MTSIYIALRHMARQRLNTIIGLVGLTLGFAVALIAVLYIWAETHYDRHIPSVERMYLLDSVASLPGRTPYVSGRLPGGLAAAVAEKSADVEAVTRVWRQYTTVKVEDRLDFYEVTASVDPSFMSMMGVELVSGSPEALADPLQVLLSEAMAKRLFAGEPALGQTFYLEGHDVQVGGVFKDWPAESHTKFDVLTGIKSLINRARDNMDGNWQNTQAYTYVRLREGASRDQLRADTQQVMKENFQLGGALPEGKTFAEVIKIGAQPVADIHLSDKVYRFGMRAPADRLRMQVLGAIATLIVVIACINYVNLSTVRAMDRAREVAMRKVLGAKRRQLVLQFLSETALLAGLALIAAFALVEMGAGFAGDLIGTALNLNWFWDPFVLMSISALFLVVVMLAGGYPAVVASASRPGRVLAENARGSKGSRALRQFLVVFQFAASIVLAISALLIAQQLNFARSADLGYEADDVMVIYGIRRSPQYTITLTRNLEAAMRGRPGIEMVAASSRTPGWSMGETVIRPQGTGPDANLTFASNSIDLDFFQTLDMKPVAGRFLDASFAGDQIFWDLEKRGDAVMPLVLNQAAVAALGYAGPDAAIGQLMTLPRPDGASIAAKVVGVAPDVHMQSLRDAIAPMIFYPDPSRFNVMLVRIDGEQREQALRSIEEGWKSVHADSLQMESVKTALADQYGAEENELRTVSVLAGLGILIAIFGQYGLAAHSAQARKREISIRKVLGADVLTILKLFVWQFSKPVLAAMLLAWPVAYVLGQNWLENFVYRIAINPFWFALVGAAVLLMALLTVAGHAFKASHVSPAHALRQD